MVQLKDFKMKAFNFQEALDGKPILTKDGQPVVISRVIDDNPEERHFVARIGLIDGFIFDETGKSLDRSSFYYELFMADDEDKIAGNKNIEITHYSSNIQRPFDLEKAKAGATICTKGGNPARFLCMDYLIPDHPVLVVTERFGREYIYRVRTDGTYSKHENEEHDNDIMMVSDKKVGFMPVIRFADNGYRGGIIYETEDEARRFNVVGKEGCVDIIRVEVEDNGVLGSEL